MKKLTNYILTAAMLATTLTAPVASSGTAAAAMPEYTELYRMDFDDVETVSETADETAFNEVYGDTAELLSPRTNFKYTVAVKEDSTNDKYLQMDSDYANDASGHSALHIWLPDGGFQANNGTYKISYDFRWNSSEMKPFLRLKTNHSTKEGLAADTVIANNGGVYNWGPMLSGVAPISDAGTRDQSAAKVYGTYSTYEGAENTGWFTTSWNNDDKISLEAGEWHTAEVMIDTVNSKAYYYFDDIYVGCQEGSAFVASLICGAEHATNIQLQIEQGWNVYNGYQLDNIIVSHAAGEFDGSDKVKIDKAEIVDCTGERAELASDITAIADKFEIAISNVVEVSGFDATLKKGSTSVPVTIDYTDADGKSGVLTITTEDYLENNTEYTLSVLGKEYSFKIEYPKMLAIGSLELTKQEAEVEDIADLTAGDMVSANMVVINPTGEDGAVTLVAACYDGDKMKSLYFKDMALPKEELAVTDSIEFSVPTASALNIKLFAVDSMESFGAITDCYVLGTEKVPVDGTVFEITETDKALANKKLTALVYMPDKTVDDLTEETDVSDVIYTALQQTADKDGKYSFKIGFDEAEASGLYKANINNGTVYTERLFYVNETENETAVNILLNPTDFVTDAKANAAALGFGEFTDNVPDAAYSILEDYYSTNTVDAANFDENLEAVKRSEIIACVNAGQIDNIFAHTGYLADQTADISGFMANSYFTESLQKSITADIKTESITKISALKACINECFVLNLVADSNGYENLTPVLKAFADEIGVNSSDITNTVSKRINGQTYSSYSALKKGIEDALTPSSLGGGGGGSLGGGISGGGSGSSGSSNNLGGIPATGTGADESSVVKEIPKNIFTDVSDDYWGRDAIVYLTERGILNGKSETLFCPEDNVTREEFTKMIVVAFCETTDAGEVGFSDVNKNEWYYDYIAIACSENLIKGYDDLTFGIGQNITRQDMAVILNRVASAYNYNFTMPEYVERFDDDADISDYAQEAVYALRNAGVVKGDGKNFNPNAFAQRAEAATIIYNMLTL